MGKTRVIAETGAGQHGVATATACALLGLECVVYMGAVDVERQALNVYRMKLLGATVVPVTGGSKTLKDAINEAMRDWVATTATTHYVLGSVLGPHPFPTMVRDFHAVIGKEAKVQCRRAFGRLPDLLVACVGGGSNAIGLFREFLADASVEMVGVEAGGRSLDPGEHAARFGPGSVGVLHGTRTLILQDAAGQVLPTHSVSAGLDYPAVGPEHARLAELGRARYVSVSDAEALARLPPPRRDRGDHPGPRDGARGGLGDRGSAAPAREEHRREPLRAGRQGRRVGREARGGLPVTRLGRAFARAKASGRAALVVFVEAGDADLATTGRLLPALAAAGADVIELGIPFSDPLADGPTIQRASERALAAGVTLAKVLDLLASARAEGFSTPVVVFSYANPILAMGEAEFAHRAREAGADGVLVTDLPPEEGRGFASVLKSARLDPVYLLAPTSPDERLRRAASLSRGFVYLVSRSGITGARAALPEDLGGLVARVRRAVPRLPVAVGFGISTPGQVRAVAALADGVVVGSAVVAAMETAVLEGRDPVDAAAALVRTLAEATGKP